MTTDVGTEMRVPLAPDYRAFNRYCPDRSEVLTHGPMLARGRNASRWHRPRSGRRYASHTGWSFWCGQMGSKGLLFSDSLPEGEQVCGACEGRSMGAGYPSSALPDAADVAARLLFTPRINPPKKCPADLFETLPGNRSGRCLYCSSVQPIRGGSRGYGWTPLHLATHAPHDLIPPCPNHGWLSMTNVLFQAVCECEVSP